MKQDMENFTLDALYAYATKYVADYSELCNLVGSACATLRAENESLKQQLAQRMPGGCKLVPVEPTDAMVQAAFHLDLSYMPGQEGVDRAAIYRAMLSAAPAQQASAFTVPALIPQHSGFSQAPAQPEQPAPPAGTPAAFPWPLQPKEQS